ncbi:MAG: hypothetical protein Q4C70_06950 [Planctomycetia bacterium]|nr:hypothetical protein [Planctomycetia bacterium]
MFTILQNMNFVTLFLLTIFLFSLQENWGAEENALKTAILEGDFPAVQDLVQHGANVLANEEFLEWESPLYWAIDSDREDIYEYLLEHGASLYPQDDQLIINDGDGCQKTPVMLAIRSRKNRIARYIVEHNLQTPYDSTRWMFNLAIWCENHEFISFLLEYDSGSRKEFLKVLCAYVPVDCDEFYDMLEIEIEYWNHALEVVKHLKKQSFFTPTKLGEVKKELEEELRICVELKKEEDARPPYIPKPDPNRPPPLE